MPLIEGVGDEVTIFFVILLFVSILTLAWFSTHIRDIPFFSLIIIELTHRRRRRSGLTQNQNQTSNQSSDIVVPAGGESDNENSVNENSVRGSEESDSNLDSSSDEGLRREVDVSKTADNINGSGNSSTANKQDITSEGNNGNSEDCTRSEEDTGPSDVSSQQEVHNIPIIPQVESLSETELRRRRVAFFENKSAGASSSELDADKEIVCGVEKLETNSISPESESVLVSERNQNVQSPVVNVIKTTKESVESRLSSEHSCGDNSGSATLSEHAEQSRDTPTQPEVSNESIDESQIRIRLKYLNDSQRQVTALPTQTVGQFRRDNFASELENNKLVRFIFNGQDLRNDANTLQAYNIVDNSVVHCLITQVERQSNQQRGQDVDDGFDIGNLMLPIFGFIICVVWYFRFEYRQFFSGTSTISLIGITFLYIAAILASWEHHRRGHAHEHME